MLNKILLRKIKFPLSLRGAFFFCHSRLSAVPAQAGESGNPSSPSLRGDLSYVIARERSDRSNLNLKGFSLIELMVAVVILSIAIFGIFLAFSTGFQGMADARDRTVAINYIQKTLEEYKNTPFNKITDKPMSKIAGTKFSNGSIVINMSKPG
jgi:prepilin-type N-terminal cleavage/methylation domain-containing protein